MSVGMFSDLTDGVSVYIPVPKGEELEAHLVAIGKAIIEDAPNIRIRTDRVTAVSIHADIEPGDCVTQIEYSITRIADPRTERKVDL